MKKYIITAIALIFTIVTNAQNVEFKSANFKEDKEGLKKAEDAIKKGEEFLALGNEAIFLVQSPGLNFQKALKEYMIAQKFNPKNGHLNFKISVCHANSTDPFKSIEFIKTNFN